MKLAMGKGLIKLGELEVGSLFLYGKSKSLALKSEYRTESGACECYIVGSGEMFWGGTSNANDLNNLIVSPVGYSEY